MRPGTLALVGVAAYAAFLVATLPASVVAQRLSSSAARIDLTEVSGTVWRGSARGVVTPSNAPPVAVDAIAWRWLPARIFAGRVAFDVNASAAGMDGSFEAGRGLKGWYASRVEARGDATALAAFVPLAAAWRPEGAITLSAPGIEIDGDLFRGEAQAEWRKASVALSEVRPLGSYRARWKSDDGKGRVTVSTLEGPLHISGEGTLTPGGRLAFAGEARAESAQAKALEPLLDLLGPRRPDGARALGTR